MFNGRLVKKPKLSISELSGSRRNWQCNLLIGRKPVAKVFGPPLTYRLKSYATQELAESLGPMSEEEFEATLSRLVETEFLWKRFPGYLNRTTVGRHGLGYMEWKRPRDKLRQILQQATLSRQYPGIIFLNNMRVDVAFQHYLQRML